MRPQRDRIATNYGGQLLVFGELSRIEHYSRSERALEYMHEAHSDLEADWITVARLDDLTDWECDRIERSIQAAERAA